MLRYLGYPAEYVRGDILLTEEQALALTGVNTFRQAADVLAANGTPVTRLMRGEEIVYIRMEHVWVRAYVPYTDYRGAGNAGGDPVWVDLDTSIKAYETVDNIYDVMEEQGFTEEAEDIAKVGDTAAIEDMLNQCYVEVNYPRYHDTEAKILKDIASQIKDSNISGTINMYSELPCCQSCSNIILEFRKMFPNIKLNVYVE